MSPRAPRSKVSRLGGPHRAARPRGSTGTAIAGASGRWRCRSPAPGFLVALILGVVGLRVQQVRLSYRLDALRAARTELEETRNRLRVELATLRSLARIEGKARAELGMVLPAPDQVRLAREFVPGGSGLTSRTPLTAAADPAAPRGPVGGTR